MSLIENKQDINIKKESTKFLEKEEKINYQDDIIVKKNKFCC